MRKVLLLLLILAATHPLYSQDFSNKGKEFWIGYGDHVGMHSGIGQQMSLYITSDVNTTGLVEIPGAVPAVSIPFTVTANQVTTVNIPNSAELDDEGLFHTGIHVTAQRPVVVYSHIYAMNVSGATLCLPVNTLGREYVSINFDQVSNQNDSYSWFFVIATEDNTTVEIVPAKNTRKGWQAGSLNTITLNRGQVYQVLSTQDLTGSTIRSVTGAGGGCKRIAVFSGSGKINIACQANNSADNLYQQAYPTSVWGKKYITINSHNLSNNNQTNFYRIIKSVPSAIVNLDGNFIPSNAFTNNLYYTFNSPGTHVISSDEPIMVAQYFTTQNCYGNPNPGDPEMIYLNPIEQTISDVTLYSSPAFQISYHGLNVVVKNGGSALTSMKLDGTNIAQMFSPVPNDPAYSYAKIPVGAGTHHIVSDSGFNAIAFGFGNAESYGYSAGTNLKDLYQFITIQNDFGTVNFPAGCKNSPFKFAMTLPYQPTQIKWVFGPQLNAMGINDTTIANPVADSTWIINGRTLQRFKLARDYRATATGTYSISIFAANPTATNGCSGEQEIQYDLQIFDQPTAGFTVTHNGCLSDSVVFTDASNGQGRPVTRWHWDFDDGNTSALKNPSHKYSTANTYTVRHYAITDVGCISDTLPKTVPISDPPVAKFATAPVRCEGSAVSFTDQTNPLGSTIVKWYWTFGDGSPQVVNTNGNAVQHTYATAGDYDVSLKVETSSGCTATITTKIKVNAKPKADFALPATICLPQGAAQFTDQSTIADGTQAQFTYSWDFGDNGTATVKNPLHNYSGAGPYPVKLQVTSNNGCTHDTTKQLTTIFAQPKSIFTAPAEICLSDTASFTDGSTAAGSTVTQWFWDFGDGTTSNLQNPKKKWTTPNTYSVTLYIKSGVGCNSDTISVPVVVHALPSANFNFSSPTCETRNITFSDISSGNSGGVVKWNWNFGDGGTAAIQNPQHTYASQGTYTVTLDVENNKGCKSVLTPLPVNVHYLPVPSFGMPGVCPTDAFAEFSDSTTIGDGSAGQFTYQWEFGDANATPGNPNTSTQKNGRHRYSVPGGYSVKLTVTSKDGCTQSTTQQFVVNGSQPKAAFTVSNPTELCSNKDVTITDGSSVDIGKLVKVEIYWDYQNDPTKKTVDNNPAPGRTYTYKYPEFGAPLTKTYQILYVVYSGVTCYHSVPQTITLKATPGIQFDVMPAVCEEITPFQVTAARETFGLAGSGTFTGTGISSSGVFDPAKAKPGLHTIRYTFNASNGCTSFADQTIRVYPTPVLDAGPDRVVLEGGYVTLTPKASGSNLSYLWTPPVGLDNPASATPKVSPPQDVEYLLTVTSDMGCIATDRVTVKLLKQIKVPNAFSPNNDGTNDKWEILYLESYPGCEVEVFNRYGQIVFRSVGYSTPWDGTYKGTPLPVGTYYWIINPKNGRKPLTGSVTIIR